MGTCTFLWFFAVSCWTILNCCTAAGQPLSIACMIPGDRGNISLTTVGALCTDLHVTVDFTIEDNSVGIRETAVLEKLRHLAELRPSIKTRMLLASSQWTDLVVKLKDSEELLTKLLLLLSERGFSGLGLLFETAPVISKHAIVLRSLKSAMYQSQLALSATFPVFSRTVNATELESVFDQYHILPVSHAFHDAGFSQVLLLQTVENLVSSKIPPKKIFAGVPPVIFVSPDRSSVAHFDDFSDMCEHRELDTRFPKVSPGGLVMWHSSDTPWSIAMQGQHSLMDIISELKTLGVGGILLPNIAIPRDSIICVNFLKFLTSALANSVRPPHDRVRFKRSTVEDRFTVIKASSLQSVSQFPSAVARSGDDQKPHLIDANDTIIIQSPGELQEWFPGLNVNANPSLPYVTHQLDDTHRGAVLDEEGNVILEATFVEDIMNYTEHRRMADAPIEARIATLSDKKVRPNVLVFSKGGALPLPVPMLLTWKSQENMAEPPLNLFEQRVLPARMPTTCTVALRVLETTTTSTTTKQPTTAKKSRRPRPRTTRKPLRTRRPRPRTTRKHSCNICQARKARLLSSRRLRFQKRTLRNPGYDGTDTSPSTSDYWN